jgi:hypothetical protein
LLVVRAGLRKVLVQLLHTLPHSLWQCLQLLLKLLLQLRLLPFLSSSSVSISIGCISASCCV